MGAPPSNHFYPGIYMVHRSASIWLRQQQTASPASHAYFHIRHSLGLDMLAAAAAASKQPTPQPGVDDHSIVLESLNQAGPFNPMASLPTKLVKRILNLDFVDISEVTVDGDTPQAAGRPPPARLPITSISQWLERFSMMAAIMVTRFPLKAPELFAYLALIVRAQRNYEGEHWVAYDRQYRRETLARRDLNWSVPDSRKPSPAGLGPSHAVPTA